MAVIVPGEVVRLSALVRRVTAPNPGMMTGPGTNTYIVGSERLALIDPGPESEAHLAAMLGTVGDRLRWILCTHTHRDHSPGARALKMATGAEVIGMRAPAGGRQDTQFAPDRVFGHGDRLDCGDFTLRAVHTPGHASNHLCYLLDRERLLFTGDHIMQGSTVVISPPDGDMVAYLKSLEALLALDIARIAPGHGYPIDQPHDEARRLIAHRLGREQKVLDAFAVNNPATLDELLPVVYADTPQRLHQVARRSLHAHLLKLESDGRVWQQGERWKLRI
ncbi:MAG: MBL fold metallo-hydrolase [Betaproteobacteria bacterium]|nr:MBL fold metallo-hydrolase [Betaproteobacteria bacterium]